MSTHCVVQVLVLTSSVASLEPIWRSLLHILVKPYIRLPSPGMLENYICVILPHIMTQKGIPACSPWLRLHRQPNFSTNQSFDQLLPIFSHQILFRADLIGSKTNLVKQNIAIELATCLNAVHVWGFMISWLLVSGVLVLLLGVLELGNTALRDCLLS